MVIQVRLGGAQMLSILFCTWKVDAGLAGAAGACEVEDAWAFPLPVAFSSLTSQSLPDLGLEETHVSSMPSTSTVPPGSLCSSVILLMVVAAQSSFSMHIHGDGQAKKEQDARSAPAS